MATSTAKGRPQISGNGPRTPNRAAGKDSLDPHGAMRLALLFLRGAAGGPWSYTLVHPPKQLAFCYVSTSGGRWKGDNLKSGCIFRPFEVGASEPPAYPDPTARCTAAKKPFPMRLAFVGLGTANTIFGSGPRLPLECEASLLDSWSR